MQTAADADSTVVWGLGGAPLNRADEAEYIVRLVGQVVPVSLETVRIIARLSEKYQD
jgi:hypothetical protein